MRGVFPLVVYLIVDLFTQSFVYLFPVENYNAQVSVCVDDAGNVEDIAAVLASRKDGIKIGVIVEVNVRMSGHMRYVGGDAVM